MVRRGPRDYDGPVSKLLTASAVSLLVGIVTLLLEGMVADLMRQQLETPAQSVGPLLQVLDALLKFNDPLQPVEIALGIPAVVVGATKWVQG